MSDKKTYKNSEAILTQAFKGIEMAAKALQDYADEPYFADDRYDSLNPTLETYMRLGEVLASAKWARGRRESDEKYAQSEAKNVSYASLDEVPLPDETKSSYTLKNNSLVLEFSSSKSLDEKEEVKYRHFVVASMEGKPLSDSHALTNAISSFEKHKEDILKDRNEIPQELTYAPNGFKIFLLEEAKASETITEKGLEQLKELKETPIIESETEGGIVCARDLRVGEEIFLKQEDGSMKELSTASLEIMDGVLIDSEDGKITKIDTRGLMKDIRLAE